MTVQNQTFSVVGLGNGSATNFSFSPMVLPTSTDITVTKVTISTGAETTLSVGTGANAYSIAATTTFPGTGSVTFPEDTVTPLTTDEKIVMKRVLTLEQQTDLENQGPYFAQVQEDQYDKFVMLDLQQQEEIDRGLKFPEGYGGTIPVITGTPAALGFLQVNSAGTEVNWVAVATVSASVSSVVPLVNSGTGSAGSAADVAREDHVHPITGIPLLASANTFTADQKITSTDASNQVGPLFTLDRASASPAVNDQIGEYRFVGRDSGGNAVNYAGIRTTILDPVNGSEDGRLDVMTSVADVFGSRVCIAQGMWTSGTTGGDKGVGTFNATTLYKAGTEIGLNPRSYLAGFGLANGTDANNDINIAAGECRNADNDGDITGTIFVKQIDANWSAGTNAGGFPSNLTIANDTWYHVHAILVGGSFDVGFDTSIAAANLISQHSATKYRRLGAVKTAAGATTLVAFTQYDDYFYWNVPILDLASTSVSNTAADVTLTTPLNVQVQAFIRTTFDGASDNGIIILSDKAIPDAAPSASASPLANFVFSSTIPSSPGEMGIWTDTSSVIRIRADATNSDIDLVTFGWLDRRGRDA